MWELERLRPHGTDRGPSRGNCAQASWHLSGEAEPWVPDSQAPLLASSHLDTECWSRESSSPQLPKPSTNLSGQGAKPCVQNQACVDLFKKIHLFNRKLLCPTLRSQLEN